LPVSKPGHIQPVKAGCKCPIEIFQKLFVLNAVVQLGLHVFAFRNESIKLVTLGMLSYGRQLFFKRLKFIFIKALFF